MFLQRFALTIWRASTDAFSYIDDFGKRRAGSGLGYLYALRVTLALIGMLPVAIGMMMVAPSADSFADRHLTVARDWYPDDLELTLKDGVLSTNKPNPVVFDLPAEWHEGAAPDKHAVVIDTSASIDDFASYDTFILVTAKAVAAQDDKEMKVWMFDQIDEDIGITKATVIAVTDAARGYAPSLPWLLTGCALALLVILPWLIGGMLWILSLLFLVWATVLLWIVSSLSGRKLRYGELYRLGLFGITSSLLASFALTMLSANMVWIPSVLFFGWMSYVITRFPVRTKNVRMEAPLPPAAATVKPTYVAKQAAPKKKPAAPAKKAPQKGTKK
jgi:hypothetical protein